jgi:hypothetical protein
MATTISFNPFQLYTKQLTDILNKARLTDNPALYLYQNGARNIIFMLEALTRIHKNMTTDEKIEKWYERFKLLEDAIGQIDYVDAFKKQFEKDKTIDNKSLQALSTATQLELSKLNTLLKEKKWLNNNFEKLDKCIVKQNFKYDAAYIEKLKATYKKEIGKIVEFAASLNGTFTKLEEEVHEMRRKLRWLSIYAQAFQGMFQLVKPKLQPSWSKKYMKKEIVNSPFNQLPKPIKGVPIISVDYYAFIALSFMISELGAIKDKGLQSHIIINKFKKTPAQVKKTLGKKYIDEKELLTKASLLAKPFFKEGILNLLIK